MGGVKTWALEPACGGLTDEMRKKLSLFQNPLVKIEKARET
jgi:hypothetical protein